MSYLSKTIALVFIAIFILGFYAMFWPPLKYYAQITASSSWPFKKKSSSSNLADPAYRNNSHDTNNVTSDTVLSIMKSLPLILNNSRPSSVTETNSVIAEVDEVKSNGGNIDRQPHFQNDTTIGANEVPILNQSDTQVDGHPSPASGNASLLDSAIILEARPQPLLPMIIRHMMNRLPQRTIFYAFHGDSNMQMLIHKFKTEIKNGKLKMINVRTLLNITKMNWLMYTPIFLNPIFWQSFEGENVLTFQTDSAICSRSPHHLEDYVGKYDYIGGPYANQGRSAHQCGGFTIRKRSKMLEAIAKCKHLWKPNTPKERQLNEDLFFSSVAVYKCPVLNVAPVGLAKTFCVDSMFYDRPFAVHKVWARFHSWTKLGRSVKSLKRFCPEISSLLGH